MRNKIFGLFFLCFSVCALNCAYAEDELFSENFEEFVDEVNEDDLSQDIVSATSVANYNVDGTVFQQITDLEQQKVLMELEKQRAQLDLDLDRLAAEKIKLQMELDTLSGRAEQQQHELEAAKAQLEIQTEQLKRQKDSIDKEVSHYEAPKYQPVRKEDTEVSRRYKLINVVGIGNQLQATVSELSTGQNKRIAVGKELDGYIVKSISLNDGIIFEKDGELESLNIGK